MNDPTQVMPKLRAGCAIGLGLLLASFGGCFAFASGRHDTGAMIFGGLLALVGFLVAGGGARVFVAHSAFHSVALECSTPTPLGGKAAVDLTLAPKKPLTLGPGSKLVLECVEEAVYSAGTDRRTYSEVLHTETLPLQLPSTLSDLHTAKLEVPIPVDVPPTWSGSSNRFYTRVVAHIDIVSWPDLALEARIEVLPEVKR
mgnify:CR=1 FL=1